MENVLIGIFGLALSGIMFFLLGMNLFAFIGHLIKQDKFVEKIERRVYAFTSLLRLGVRS